MQEKAAMQSALSLDNVITVYREEPAQVEVFKYPGQLMYMDDNDRQAICNSLKKARR